MQHVTMKSTHFTAWIGHFMLVIWAGAFTGGLIGLVLRLLVGDTGTYDIGLGAVLGIVLYLVLFIIYIFVRAALGYEEY